MSRESRRRPLQRGPWMRVAGVDHREAAALRQRDGGVANEEAQMRAVEEPRVAIVEVALQRQVAV